MRMESRTDFVCLFVCLLHFVLFFKAGFLSVALAVLELAL